MNGAMASYGQKMNTADQNIAILLGVSKQTVHRKYGRRIGRR
jgi:hypothetical protein